MKAIFEIKRASNGKYCFNLKSSNGQVILTSQAYESKEGAQEGIASVRQNAGLEERYEEKTGSDGLPYFVLIAANKQVIGRSQMYSSRSVMRRGMASVKKNAGMADTFDYTAHLSAGERSRGAA